MTGVLIVVPGEPKGKGRPRAAKRGAFITLYTPPETKAEEERIQAEARLSMEGREPMSGPVKVEVSIYHAIRKSWPKKKQEAARANKIAATVKPDPDNCAKLYLDAFNGVVWTDDVNVTQLTIGKYFADEPLVMVSVIPLDLPCA